MTDRKEMASEDRDGLVLDFESAGLWLVSLARELLNRTRDPGAARARLALAVDAAGAGGKSTELSFGVAGREPAEAAAGIAAWIQGLSGAAGPRAVLCRLAVEAEARDQADVATEDMRVRLRVEPRVVRALCIETFPSGDPTSGRCYNLLRQAGLENLASGSEVAVTPHGEAAAQALEAVVQADAERALAHARDPGDLGETEAVAQAQDDDLPVLLVHPGQGGLDAGELVEHVQLLGGRGFPRDRILDELVMGMRAAKPVDPPRRRDRPDQRAQAGADRETGSGNSAVDGHHRLLDQILPLAGWNAQPARCEDAVGPAPGLPHRLTLSAQQGPEFPFAMVVIQEWNLSVTLLHCSYATRIL